MSKECPMKKSLNGLPKKKDNQGCEAVGIHKSAYHRTTQCEHNRRKAQRKDRKMIVNTKSYQIEREVNTEEYVGSWTELRFEVAFGDTKTLGGSFGLGHGFKGTRSIRDLSKEQCPHFSPSKSLELMIETILDYSDDIRTEVENLLRVVKRYHSVHGFTDCGRPTKKGIRFLDRLDVGDRITQLRIKIKELLNQ